MGSSGEQTQHAHGVGFVAGFTENFAVDDDDRVGAKNRLAGMLSEACQCFFPRQALRASAGLLARLRLFRNVGWTYGERNAGIAQQLLTARRGGGEHEHRPNCNRTLAARRRLLPC